jgi:hypothetical protein
VAFRLVGLIFALSTPLLAMGIIRRLGFVWSAALAASVVTFSTALFWVYSRAGLGIAPPLAVGLVALIVHERELDRFVHRWIAPIAAGFGFLASWVGAGTVLAAGFWLYRSRGWDSLVRRWVLGAAAGAAITFVWILNATTLTEVSQHTLHRVTGGPVSDFIASQFQYASDAAHPVVVAMIAAGVIAALWSKVTRPATAVLFVPAAAWIVLLNGASRQKDFFALPLLAAGVIGLGYLFDRAAKHINRGWLVWVVATVVAIFSVVSAPRARQYAAILERASSGELLARNQPADHQEVLLHNASIKGPRWAAWYWDMTTATIESATLCDTSADDLILLDVAEFSVHAAPVDTIGSYALYRVGDIEPCDILP